MARKRASKPTTSRRSNKQALKDRYAHAREDAQLAGLIPTVPEEALKSERVDPAQQSEQQLPELVAMAARNGWATPDHIKPKIVDALIEPFVKRDTVTAPDGSVYEVPPDRYLLTKNAQVLATLDKMQHERDNPDDAKAAVDVDVNVCMDLGTLLKRAKEQREVQPDIDAQPPTTPPAQINDNTP